MQQKNKFINGAIFHAPKIAGIAIIIVSCIVISVTVLFWALIWVTAFVPPGYISLQESLTHISVFDLVIWPWLNIIGADMGIVCGIFAILKKNIFLVFLCAAVFLFEWLYSLIHLVSFDSSLLLPAILCFLIAAIPVILLIMSRNEFR